MKCDTSPRHGGPPRTGYDFGAGQHPSSGNNDLAEEAETAGWLPSGQPHRTTSRFCW